MEPDTDSAPTRRSARSRPSVPDEPQQRRSSSASLILEDAPTAQPRSDTLEPDDDDDEEEEEEEDDAMDESKSEGELDAIHQEMQQLEQSIPNLSYAYKLVGRLGEGTFSSVYKALDLNHDLHDNSQWHTPAPSDAHKPGKVYVALKRIYVTSSPVRIFNELDILSDLRGADNVAFLIAALRHEDQVIAVMPYNRHQDYRSYYRTATMPLLRSYFACLFRALAATHDKAIIHRDVKPANFLYDLETGVGVLCDFGLAQKIGGEECYEWLAKCCHSLPGPSLGGLKGREKARRKIDRLLPGQAPGLAAGVHGARLLKPVCLTAQAEKLESDYRALKVAMDLDPVNTPPELVRHMRPFMIPRDFKPDMEDRAKEASSYYKNWSPSMPSGLGGRDKPERVGYLKEDRRPSVRANRAGTRGFRAPEVLLKCPDQTVSLDIWSAGIILLCFLTRRFPFFNSNDDTEALVEIAAIVGRKKMERCAALHSTSLSQSLAPLTYLADRTFITNIPTLDVPPHANFHDLVKSLNPPIVVENSPNPYGSIPSKAEDDAVWYPTSELALAVDLMKRCLDTDCTRRYTAEECLDHEFFKRGEYAGNGGRGVM